MACAHFGDLGARTLIHPALKLRAYYVILGGQDGIAGLGAPCSRGDRRTQSFLGELLLIMRAIVEVVRSMDIRDSSFNLPVVSHKPSRYRAIVDGDDEPRFMQAAYYSLS